MRYKEYHPFPNVEWRNAVQRHFEVPVLARLLALPGGGDLLEVGCGRGVALGALIRACRPASLTGIDLDPALLAEAGVAVPDARLVAADVRALPFHAGAFDLVVDFGTLHHVPDGAAALREIERVLRPGGLFVYETRLAQAVAHPGRFDGAPPPWDAAPRLVPHRRAGFWATRLRSAGGPGGARREAA